MMKTGHVVVIEDMLQNLKGVAITLADNVPTLWKDFKTMDTRLGRNMRMYGEHHFKISSVEVECASTFKKLWEKLEQRKNHWSKELGTNDGFHYNNDAVPDEYIGVIYLVSLTNKSYVGRMTGRTLLDQYKLHTRVLYPKKLTDAFGRYGTQNFSINAVEVVLASNEAELEQKLKNSQRSWVERLDSINNGFNDSVDDHILGDHVFIRIVGDAKPADEEEGKLTGVIYCIKNLMNGKLYIGQTSKTLERRLRIHITDAKRHRMKIGSVLQEFGVENFEGGVVEFVYADTSDELERLLDEREIYWIKELNSRENGYNDTDGGKGCPGRATAEETRAKIALANMAENNGMFGTKWSEEKRESMRELMLGPNNHNYGKPLSDEVKAKLSDALRGRVISTETREQISATLTGIKRSEETRKKMSEARQGKGLSEETVEKIKSTRLKGDDNTLSKAVYQLTMDGEVVQRHGSMSDAARAIDSYPSVISNICRGVKTSTKGYRFCYEHALDDVVTSIKSEQEPVASPEALPELSAPRTMHETVRQNVSESLKQYYASEEGKANKSSAHEKRSETMAKERDLLRSSITEKKCNNCHQTKAVSEFGKKAAAKDGCQANCKVCCVEIKREWKKTCKA